MQSIHPDDSSRKYRSLLIPEQPLQVLRTLATAIGLDEAIVLQQLFWLLEQPGNGKVVGEHRWIFNTHEEWRKSYFPFWSERTIRRIFTHLETMHIVASCQPEGTLSRRKYYRLNEGMLNRFLQGRIPTDNPEPAILAESKRKKRPLPLTERTIIDDLSKESKGTPSVEGACNLTEKQEHQAMWKPDKRTKAQKLATIKVPDDYPSEAEFDAFLEDEDCVAPEYRPDLYSTLCDRKWHHWNADYAKWTRIRDWKAYVLALDGKIAERD